MPDSPATIREATDADLADLAEGFRAMWLEIGWRARDLRADADAVVADFVARAREDGEFAAFVAEVGGAVVGTVACQLFSGLYPEIRRPSSHRAGYIWGVYVHPDHRRQGLATRLTRAALAHLEAIGCRRVALHASRDGAPVYRSLGFRETNELALELRNRP